MISENVRDLLEEVYKATRDSQNIDEKDVLTVIKAVIQTSEIGNLQEFADLCAEFSLEELRR